MAVKGATALDGSGRMASVDGHGGMVGMVAMAVGRMVSKDDI